MPPVKKEKNINCSNCSKENSGTAKFCIYCGSPLITLQTSEIPSLNKDNTLPIKESEKKENNTQNDFLKISDILKTKTTVSTKELTELKNTYNLIKDKKGQQTLNALAGLLKNYNKYLTNFVFKELKNICPTNEYEKHLENYLIENPSLAIGTLLASQVELTPKIINYLENFDPSIKELHLQKITTKS